MTGASGIYALVDAALPTSVINDVVRGSAARVDVTDVMISLLNVRSTDLFREGINCIAWLLSES